MNVKTLQKGALVVGVVAAIAAFRYFELDRYLSLSYIKSSQASFAALYAQHQIAVLAGYFAIYVVVTAISLPGATVMTLAGGGLFGLFTGTLVVSFASTIGATLACLAARFLLRDWVQKKVGDRMAAINRGVENEGAFYLFTLRLIPAFPFFVINLAMGLTRLRLRTFYWVSQVGMLPGTLVYVNAGKELAGIESLSGILSPSLIASFAILGLFPIAVKKIMGRFNGRRAGSPAPSDESTR